MRLHVGAEFAKIRAMKWARTNSQRVRRKLEGNSSRHLPVVAMRLIPHIDGGAAFLYRTPRLIASFAAALSKRCSGMDLGIGTAVSVGRSSMRSWSRTGRRLQRVRLT